MAFLGKEADITTEWQNGHVRKVVTINDVAARLGVSKMTVSNVLSSDLTRQRKVSEETRARVLEAVEQMRYRPNATARSLRLRRTNIIGLYSGYNYLSPENAFFAAIIGGAQQACDEHRKDLLLHGVFRGHSVRDIHSELVDGRIDGLILKAPPGDPLLDMLAESPLPVVALAEATPLLPVVLVDDRDGSQQIAAHLANKGHRRIVYHTSTRPLASARNRWEAFQAAAQAWGLEIVERPVTGQLHAVHITDSEAKWLDAPREERPTAAVCWNDLAAYDLLRLAHQRGLRVPEDLAIVGFDGVIRSPRPDWELTTIRAPWAEAARTAVRLLAKRLEGEAIPQETILPVELIAGSTA